MKIKNSSVVIFLIIATLITASTVILWTVFFGQFRDIEKKSLLRESFKPGEFRQPAGEFRPNIILITIDNLRADALGVYGNWDAQTPAVDSLLVNGAVFDSYFETTPLALPNVTTLLTGLYPPEHGVRDDLHFRLNDSFDTLAEILKREGYFTSAFLGGAQLRKRLGLGQGFDQYDDSLLQKDGAQPELFPASLPAEKLNEKIIASLSSNPQAGKPVFLWIQYSDLKPPFKKQGVISETDDLYGKAVAGLDLEIGKLLEYLKSQAWYQNSVIVVTATKPQNLGEHRERMLGAYLYDVDLKAPLIISSPQLFTGRVAIKRLTASIDLVPSVLELLSLKTTSNLSGQSFLNALKGAVGESDPAGAGRMVYLESFVPTATYGIYPTRGIRSIEGKLVVDGPKKTFFDITDNPLEILSDDTKYEESIARYSAALEKIESSFTPRPTQEAYGAAGFAAGAYGDFFQKMAGVVLDNNFLAPLEFEKSRTQTFEEQIALARELQGGKTKYNDLLKRVRENLAVNPYNLTSRITLSELYHINPVYSAEAISEAYLALKQDPLNLPTYQFIARLFTQAGLNDKMSEVWRLAGEANPSWVSPVLNLAAQALTESKDSEVEGIISSFAKTNPIEASSIWVMLASNKIEKKEWPQALEYLNQALALSPKNLIGLGARAQVLLELGKPQEALQDLSILKGHNPDLMEQILYRSIIYYATDWKNMNLAKELLREFKRMAQNPYFPTLADAYIEEVRNEPYVAIEKLSLIVKSESDKDKKAWLYQKIAGLYYGKKNSAKAKEYYQKALAVNPYLPEAANNYAWIVGVEDKKVQEAFKWIYKAIAKMPNNPHLLDTLAELHYLDGRTDLSIKIEEEAVKMDPKNKSFRDNLARYQKALKKAA